MKLKETETGKTIDIQSMEELMNHIKQIKNPIPGGSTQRAIIIFDDGTYLDYEDWIE